MKVNSFIILLLSLITLLSCIRDDGTEITTTSWTPLFEGIHHAQAKLIRKHYPIQSLNVIKVALKNKHINFFATPPNLEKPGHTSSENTADFLTQNKLQVAFNTHFYYPCCDTTQGSPRFLMGLSIAQGTLVTSPNMASPFKSTLFFDKNNNATLSNTIPDQLDDIYIAITGSQILKKGKPVLNINSLKPESRYRHPRTAVGLSKDKHYLYVFVIDGRQPGYSEGATLLELAKWTRHFGAYQAINLDGGGSSTLVIDKGKNTPYLLNRVSGKQLRSNGSHLGISAPALKPN